VVKQKFLKFLCCIWLIGFCAPLQAQDQSHGWNGVIVKTVSPEVSVIREGSPISIYEWGMTLDENDEVQTGKNGRASVRFSSEAKGNEIILGRSTRVRVSRSSAKFDYSTYQITVIHGKIWAKDFPLQKRKVQVDAGVSHFISAGGEYVVEQLDERTLATSIHGKLRVLDRSLNKYESPLPGEIISVFDTMGILTIRSIPEQLMADFSSPTADSSESAEEIIHFLRFGKERTKATVLIVPNTPTVPNAPTVPNTPAVSVILNKPSIPVPPVVPLASGTVIENSGGQPMEKPAIPSNIIPSTTGSDLPLSPEPEPGFGEKQREARGIPDPAPPPVVVVIPPITEAVPEPLWVRYKWHIVASSAFLFSSWMALEEAKKYNNLASENESLKTQWASASTSSDRTSLEVKYEVNKKKMSTSKTNVDQYNMFSLIAIGFEGYLLYRDFFGNGMDSAKNISQSAVYGNVIKPNSTFFEFSNILATSSIRLSANWKW